MPPKPPAAPPPAGRLVRAAKSGKHQVIRTRSFWTDAAEQVFLEHLAATCNVSASAAAAGFSYVAVYRRRRQWPAFAAAWDAAREEGWLRLELQLLHAATATLEPGAGAEATPEPSEAGVLTGPAMSVEQAMQLWFRRPGARDGAGGGRGRGHGWRRQEPDIDEVRADVLRRVAAIEKARGKGK